MRSKERERTGDVCCGADSSKMHDWAHFLTPVFKHLTYSSSGKTCFHLLWSNRRWNMKKGDGGGIWGQNKMHLSVYRSWASYFICLQLNKQSWWNWLDLSAWPNCCYCTKLVDHCFLYMFLYKQNFGILRNIHLFAKFLIWINLSVPFLHIPFS